MLYGSAPRIRETKHKESVIRRRASARLFNKIKLRDYNGKEWEELNMAEEKTFTQEEVNNLVGQARLEGKEIGRKEFADFISPDDFTKKTEGLTKELSDLKDQMKKLEDEKAALETQITEKDGAIAEYEKDSVKTRIARELGLAPGAEDYLQGDDEEAIRKSAETLKDLIGTQKVPGYNPEQPTAEDGVTAAFKKLNPNIKL